MPNPLDDERLRFYLRHRDDIRDWAAIEKDVALATREILAGIQPDLKEQLARIDPDVTTARRDGGRYERIVARRPSWPGGVGIAIEWETGVDPFGSSLPKYGILFLVDDTTLEPARLSIVALATTTRSFAADGFRIGSDRYWPIVRWTTKSTDWWSDPETWTGAIVRALVNLWPSAAKVVDEGLGRERVS